MLLIGRALPPHDGTASSFVLGNCRSAELRCRTALGFSAKEAEAASTPAIPSPYFRVGKVRAIAVVRGGSADIDQSLNHRIAYGGGATFLIPSTFHLHASDAAECDRGIISPVSGNRHGFSLQMRETRLSRIELWPPFSPLNISSSSQR